MMTLRDLFNTMWDITVVKIDAREDGTRLIHQFIFSQFYHPGLTERHDIEAGKITVVLGRINHHGEPTRNGSEMAWGWVKGSIPDYFMDAEIVHFLPMSNYSEGGHTVYISINTSPEAVELIRPTLNAVRLEDLD
jgi:hypothetical protein